MAREHVVKDLTLVGLSILFALFLLQSGVVHTLVAAGTNIYVDSFVAGIFFTSILTTAPAMVVLGELSQEGNIVLVALLGGAGAVVGDYLIFAFVRDRLSEDIAHFMSRSTLGKFHAMFRRRAFKWLLPFIGGFIIASPLPDELGLMLLGMTRMSTVRFVPLSFAFNAAGILLIGLIAQGGW